MKEILKITSKKLYVILFIISGLYFALEYSNAFILKKYASNPLTVEKMTKLIIIMSIVYVLMAVTGHLCSYCFYMGYEKIRTTIRKYYFKKIQNMTSKNITDNHTGYINNLIEEVSTIFAELVRYISDTVFPLLIGMISFIGVVCTESLTMGLICITITTIAVFTKYKMMKNRQKYDKDTRKKQSNYMAIFIDFVQNITTVKKLGIADFCNERIDDKVQTYISALKISEMKKQTTNTIFHFFMNCLYIIVFISTLFMVKQGKDALPYLLFYTTILGSLYSRINGFVKLLDARVRFNTAKQQLDEVLNNNIELETIYNFDKIELKDLKFSYKDNLKIIEVPEFTLCKGEKISIMGESGQGKTTVMNILAGIYKIDNGKLLIDGKEVKNKKLDLVFVSQEVDLFDLTIRENLCLGKDVKEEKILELFKDAGLLEWYKSLPDGLDTLVGERGIKLSAGQKQRLNLIRGILIDKVLYFFDEPTSNLDKMSEIRITNMIKKYLKDKTYIIITHRDKLKELCDRHYIMNNNKMSLQTNEKIKV